MGSVWSFDSFDRERWDAIFGGGAPGAEQAIVDGMLWDNDGYFDDDGGELRPGPNREQVLASEQGEKARRLAAHLARNGFTYNGLDAATALQLDDFARHLGTKECLGDELDVQNCNGNDFLRDSITSELLRRVGYVRPGLLGSLRKLAGRDQRIPARLLPLFATGRRPGNAELPRGVCHYVIFSPDEVAELRAEVEAAIRLPIPWDYPDEDPGMTEECMLVPLTNVVQSSRWLLMNYA